MANELTGKLTAQKMGTYNDLLAEEKNLEEFIRCANDINYFLEHYYMIVSLDKGLINFPIREWQRDVCEKIIDAKYTLNVIARQQGKTTLVAGIILWMILFSNNYYVAIIANKYNRAKEVISKIDLAYTYLPDFLKMPTIKRNMGEIQFINESRAKAFATSPDSVRGESINCLYVDEMAFLPAHVQSEFMASTVPTIISGKETKIIITSTPNGIGNEFYRLYRDGVSGVNDYIVSKYTYKCNPEQDNEEFRQKMIIELGSEERFKVEYECEFLSSTTSAFDYGLLKSIDERIKDIVPKYEVPSIGLKVFSDEIKEYLTNSTFYVGREEMEINPFISQPKEEYMKFSERKTGRFVTIDCAEGLGGDFSVAHFMRFDFERRKIVQEAVLRSNSLSIDMFAGYIYGICSLLGNPFVIFENNNKAGGEFKKTFVQQYRYRNCYFDKKKKDFGVYTLFLNKKLGVRTFKDLLAFDIIEINDYDTYIELNYFEEYPIGSGKFKAQIGYTDDAIMALVVFCGVYQTNKDLFAVQYGKRAVIDYMINPDLEKNLLETAENGSELEKFLTNKINENKKDTYGEYDWEVEMAKENNIDLIKLQDAGVNISLFKTVPGGSNKDSFSKMKNWHF